MASASVSAILGDVRGARDQHDGNRRPARVALLDEHVAALAAQVDVEQDDVDVPSLQLGPCRVQRLRLAHLVAVELEIDPAKQPNRRLVVDHKNPDGRRMPPGIAHLARVYRPRRRVRTRGPREPVYLFEVAKDFPQPRGGGREVRSADPAGLPLPTQRFRRRAWLAFQRALDPLAPPKPLPLAARGGRLQSG